MKQNLVEQAIKKVYCHPKETTSNINFGKGGRMNILPLIALYYEDIILITLIILIKSLEIL